MQSNEETLNDITVDEGMAHVLACACDKESGAMVFYSTDGQTIDETANLTALFIRNLFHAVSQTNGNCCAEEFVRELCEKIISVEKENPEKNDDEISKNYPYLGKTEYESVFLKNVEDRMNKGLSDDEAIRQSINRLIWEALLRQKIEKLTVMTQEEMSEFVKNWRRELEGIEGMSEKNKIRYAPCPRCGYDVIKTRKKAKADGSYEYSTGCWKCGFFAYGKTQHEADAKWNSD